MKNKNNSFLKEKQITFKGINPSKADSLTMVLPKEVVVWSPYEAADINRLVQEQKPPFIYAGGDKLDDVGWYYENNHHDTKPVGLKLPNLLDLYDMRQCR